MNINFPIISYSNNYQKSTNKRPLSTKIYLSKHSPLAFGSVSFGAYIKKTLQQEIKNFGEENIPEPVLKIANEKISLQRDKDVSIFSIHQAYYAALENAKTLKEVKQIYPEFKDVKQVSDISFNKAKNSTINQIKLGNIKGLTPENTALVLLKHVYCGNQSELLENLTQSTYQKLKETLSIPGLDKRYASYLLSSRRYLNPEFKNQASERMKAQRLDPEFNAKSLDATRQNLARLNQDPDYIKRRAERNRQMHKNPEYAAKRDENIRLGREKLNSTPELRAKQIEATRRKSKEFDYANIHSEAMSRAMLRVWAVRPQELQGLQAEFAKDFPKLGPIIEKKRAHQKLDESELGYLKLYYKALYENYPELKEHLSDNFGKAYETAYRTVKEEYDSAKTQGRLDELLKSWGVKK